MQKPKGMSRKEYHSLRTIVREFLSDPTVPVDLLQGGAAGFKGYRHDEGYNSSFVEVFSGDQPGTFEVRVESAGSDCDGRHSNCQNYIVGETSKRRRFYMGRNWETSRPAGKFQVKSRFQIRKKGSSFQRDYRAEAAGY